MNARNFTREELAEYILHTAKESSLSKIRSILGDNENEIVAFSVTGEPINKDSYLKLVSDANDSIEKGNYRTSEELNGLINNW